MIGGVSSPSNSIEGKVMQDETAFVADGCCSMLLSDGVDLSCSIGKLGSGDFVEQQ
jgi:hypothetical protein